jgi:hypothetical protein
MSFFLMSFPNQITSPACSLIVIDILHEQAHWVRLENHVPNPGEGVCGICRASGFVAICTQSVSPCIVLLHPTTLEVIHTHALSRVKDPHSIIFYDGYLYVVSTGTNEIYRLKAEDSHLCGEELFWRYPGSSCDTDEVHLNGITVSNNGLIATAFGPKVDGKWGSNGCVFYPVTAEVISEGLRQPHTPICSEDSLFFAESSKGTLHVYKRESEGKWIHSGHILTGGYPRGIALLNEKLFIGISSTRNVSKSQGIMLGEQELISRAGIMCLDMPDLSPVSISDLSAFTREIYDILPVESAIALDSFNGALLDRVREMQNSGERSVDQIGRLDAALNKASRDQQQLEAEKQQLEAEKLQLEVVKQELEAKQQKLMTEMEKMRDELGVILRSRSWHLTAPMRLLNRKCKQILEDRRWF